MTKTPADLVRELHRIHIQLRDLRERMDRGPKQIKAHEGNVARAEARLQEIKTAQKAHRVLTDQKQLQLKSAEAKIVDLRVKLNQASSNREYQALKDQIAADEMANSVLADEILEALEKADEYAAQVAEADRVLTLAKEELAKTQQQVRTELAVVEGDLGRVEGLLRDAEKELPNDIREPYLRMVKGKGSEGMAKVEGETCEGCYTQLSPNLMSSLYGNKIVFCQSCGRLLYLPEDRRPARGK